MLYANNTVNNGGITLYGDLLDFEELYNTLHEVVGEEGENKSYDGPRLRVLGLCYDIRHAMMSDRAVVLVENGMDRDKMKYHSIISSEKNVYYSFPTLWPEMLFVLMSLNDFIQIYKRKNKLHEIDPKIAIIRNFQGAILKCLQETITSTTYKRIYSYINNAFSSFSGYITQYIDILNCRFIDMDKEKRLKNISVMAKRIFEQGEEYREVKVEVVMAAKEYKCSVENIRMKNYDYPEEIDW